MPPKRWHFAHPTGLAVGLRPIECTLRESDGSNFLSLVLTYSIQKTGSDTFGD